MLEYPPGRSGVAFPLKGEDRSGDTGGEHPSQYMCGSLEATLDSLVVQ